MCSRTTEFRGILTKVGRLVRDTHSPAMAGFRMSWALVTVAALLLGGCGEALTEGAAAPKTATQKPAAPAAAATQSTLGRLDRQAVDVVLTEKGPQWVFQRVVPEEVFVEGKFVGWRIVSMPKEWESLDIKPGDVVTRVNGLEIERPEDMWRVWTSVYVASELKIAYQREGKARELVLSIDGQAAKELPSKLRDDAPPPRKSAGKKRVIVIEGAAPPESDADAEDVE